MNPADLQEFFTANVLDAGVPNLERIALQASTDLEMASYAVIVGLKGDGNSITPLIDNFFWMGKGSINQGDWVFLYTGRGTNGASEIPNNTQKLFSIFWQRPKTIFNHPLIIPAVIRLDGVRIMEWNSRSAIASQAKG